MSVRISNTDLYYYANKVLLNLREGSVTFPTGRVFSKLFRLDIQSGMLLFSDGTSMLSTIRAFSLLDRAVPLGSAPIIILPDTITTSPLKQTVRPDGSKVFEDGTIQWPDLRVSYPDGREDPTRS